jgi:hypothetical protein
MTLEAYQISPATGETRLYLGKLEKHEQLYQQVTIGFK